MPERVSLLSVIGDVARASAPWVALATLCALPSCCLVGLPVFWAVAGVGYLRAMGASRAVGLASWRVGLLGTPLFFAPIASLFLSVALLDPHGGSSRLGLVDVSGTIAVSALIGAVLLPLYAAPLAAVESSASTLEALLASGARAARNGLADTLLRGAAVGAIGALPWLVPPLARPIGDAHPFVMMFALYVAVVMALVVAIGIVAHGYGGGVERFGAARTLVPSSATPRTPATARLSSSLALALSPVVLVALALLFALLTPTDPWRQEPLPQGDRDAVPIGTLLGPEPLEGSAEGLVVRSEGASTFVVETQDGGGAGRLEVRGGDAQRATLARERFRGVEAWTLRVPRHGDVVLASFDDRGVRLDDAPLDRLEARVGGNVGVSLASLYAVALLALLAAQLRRAGTATGLDRPRFQGKRELAAMTGVLRTDTPVFVTAAAKVAVRGGARLELGELGSVTLPEGEHPLLVPSNKSTLRDGDTVTLLATLPATTGSPFRTGATPLPADARLVIGVLEDAREQYAERVARTTVLAALPLLVLAIALTTMIVVHL